VIKQSIDKQPDLAGHEKMGTNEVGTIYVQLKRFKHLQACARAFIFYFAYNRVTLRHANDKKKKCLSDTRNKKHRMLTS